MTFNNAFTDAFKSFQPKSVEEIVAASKKAYEDFAAETQANIQAVVEANTLLIKGSEALVRDGVATAKASVEKSIAAGQTLATVKSPQELVSLQVQLVQEAAQTAVADATRLTEETGKVVKAALEPITARVQAAVAAVVAKAA